MAALNARWVKALNHPLRVRILELALSVETISASEVAKALDASLGVVSYHVRVLHGTGLLVGAGFNPVRGSVKRCYRLEDPALTARALAQASELARLTAPADADHERRDGLIRTRLGVALTERREAAGMTLPDRAARVGVGASTLASIESGDVDPVSTLLCRIGRELDSRPGDLLDEAVFPAA
jgi:DNA-binding transcriptional ArsR family regulator